MTPLGVVFLFMLVNWWVEKHQSFLFNVYKRFFFYFSHVFTFFNVFYFFLERFLHLWFGCYWTGGASHCEAPTDIEQYTDVSLVSGKLRHIGTTTNSDDVSQQQAAVVNRDEQMTVADNAAGM